jgi:phosphoglucomutase
LWAVLLWLDILAARRQSVRDIVLDHWRAFGRDFYSRHDFEEVDAGAAEQLMGDLRLRLAGLAGQRRGEHEIVAADDFSYHDPVDGSDSGKQGIRIMLADGSRIVYRLSGTGTEGATLRVYLERFEKRVERHGQETQSALSDLVLLSRSLPDIPGRLGRDDPTVIT